MFTLDRYLFIFKLQWKNQLKSGRGRGKFLILKEKSIKVMGRFTRGIGRKINTLVGLLAVKGRERKVDKSEWRLL